MIIDPQTVQQAQEGSRIVLDGAMIGLIVTNLGILGKAWLDRKKLKKYNGDGIGQTVAIAGKALVETNKAVAEHETRITVLEKNVESLNHQFETYHKENREDHNQIYIAISGRKLRG
jgi:uncharacterized coiled-coil protein SlyX